MTTRALAITTRSLRADFVANRTVSDPAVLPNVAGEIGLDGDEFAIRFERDNAEYAAASSWPTTGPRWLRESRPCRP